MFSFLVFFCIVLLPATATERINDDDDDDDDDYQYQIELGHSCHRDVSDGPPLPGDTIRPVYVQAKVTARSSSAGRRVIDVRRVISMK